MNKLFIKNNDGKPSVTLTAFVLGFIVVNLKLILSGFTIGTVTISAFTGTEYGVSLSALGAVYVLRKATGENKKNDSSKIE